MALIEDVIGLLERRFTHRDEIDCFVLHIAPERQPSPLALLRIDRLHTFLAQQSRPEFSVGNCRRTNRLPIHQASEKLAVWLSDEQLHQDRSVEIHGRFSKKAKPVTLAGKRIVLLPDHGRLSRSSRTSSSAGFAPGFCFVERSSVQSTRKGFLDGLTGTSLALGIPSLVMITS